MALTGLQRVEQRVGKAEGQEKAHREVNLPQLGNPAICVHVCVAA